MKQIDSFRDLRAYRCARSHSLTIFEVSTRFPRCEQYALTSQMRRSSRAVGALIAEAWGLRAYPAAFVDKLWRALAEAKETQAWLDTALDCHYLSQVEHVAMDAAWDAVAGMLFQMIRRHESFCLDLRKGLAA